MTGVPCPVVLDCDPGHDDMVAIMLAAASPAIDLKAITVVAGNGPLERTVHNARATCAMAGITGVPIAAGASGPLVGELETAPHVHGESALDGAELPDVAAVPLSQLHAVELVAEVLRESDEPVTLVPVGPLTNVALLLRTYPELALEKVREVVLMGGGVAFGNVRPLAEFNIRVDPEAADVVFTSGLPVTMCPLDVTHQALATPEVLERLRSLNTPLSETVVALLTFFTDRYEERWGMRSPPVHDPVAVARVIDPSLVEVVDAFVAVELNGTHTRGATVTDLHGVLGREPNCRVATMLDAPRFWDHVIDAVASLGA